MTTCTRLTDDQLLASLDSDPVDRRVDRHLDGCAPCRARRQRLAAPGRALALLARTRDADPLPERILRAATAAARDVALRLLGRLAMGGAAVPGAPEAPDGSQALLDGLHRLDRRLRGAGIDLGLARLPTRSAGARGGGLRRQALALLEELAGPDAWLEAADAALADDYQPTAAPSFLDSLAPW